MGATSSVAKAAERPPDPCVAVGGTVTISPAHNRSLCVSAGKHVGGTTRVVVKTADIHDQTQHWRILQHDDAGTIALQNVAGVIHDGGRALGAAGHTHLAPHLPGSADQGFVLDPGNGQFAGAYLIRSKCKARMVLDVDCSGGNGAPVWINKNYSDPSSHFFLTLISAGTPAPGGSAEAT